MVDRMGFARASMPPMAHPPARNVVEQAVVAAPPPPPEIEKHEGGTHVIGQTLPAMPQGSLPPANQDVQAAFHQAWMIWRDKPTKVEAEGRDVLGAARPLDDKATSDSVIAMFANRKLEKAALAELSPAERQAYHALEAKLGDDGNAQLALQLMLISGKLGDKALVRPPGNPPKPHEDLLTTLTRLSTQPVPPGMTNEGLLSQVLMDMADPTRIDQNKKNTCGVAALQVQMATQHPAEYARIIAGLADPAGKPIDLATGTVAVAPDVMHPDKKHGLSPTSNLWQNTFMNLGAGLASGGATYSSHEDVITLGNGDTIQGGMPGIGVKKAAAMLFGQEQALFDGGVKLYEVGSGINAALARTPKPKIDVTLEGGFDAAGNAVGKPIQATITKMDGNKIYYVDKAKPGVTQVMLQSEFEAKLKTCGQPPYDRDKDLVGPMWNNVDVDLAAGHQPLVAIKWGAMDAKGDTKTTEGATNGIHYVTVTQVKDGKVYFLNSMGSEESMPLEAFKSRMKATVTHDDAKAAKKEP